MAELKIVVTVPKDGQNVKIEPFGYKGDACLKATASIEEALGVVKDRQKKPEAYQGPVIADKTKVGA